MNDIKQTRFVLVIKVEFSSFFLVDFLCDEFFFRFYGDAIFFTFNELSISTLMQYWFDCQQPLDNESIFRICRHL